MKVFKTWVVIRDRSPQDAEFYSSQRLARLRKQDLSSLFQHVEYAFVEVRPLPKKKPAAKRVLPKPGRKMSHTEAQAHADKKYGKAFRKLAESDTSGLMVGDTQVKRKGKHGKA